MQTEFSIIARQSQVELRILETSVSVKSDKKLLRRILQNLVSNAIRYAGETRRARVIVGVRRIGKGEINVYVIDNGIGIEESQQSSIFNEFHQLEPGAQSMGRGLGLTIVDRMSKLLSHQLTLESEVHKGSVFCLAVPREQSQIDQPQTPQPKTTEGLSDEQFLANKTVLLIENEVQIQQAVSALLSTWGAKIVVADSYASIQENCPKAPDVMLVDYHLNNGETGVIAAQTSKQRWSKQVPGILFTANRNDSVKDEAASAGLSFLPKPIKPAALKRALKQSLS